MDLNNPTVKKVTWLVIVLNALFVLLSLFGMFNTYSYMIFCPLALPFAYNNGIPVIFIVPVINIFLAIGILFRKNLARVLFIVHQIINSLIALFLGVWGILFGFASTKSFPITSLLSVIINYLLVFSVYVALIAFYKGKLTIKSHDEQLKKKKPAGIAVFSLLIIISSFMGFFAIADGKVDQLTSMQIFDFFFYKIVFIVSIVTAVFLLKTRKWAKVSIIVISALVGLHRMINLPFALKMDKDRTMFLPLLIMFLISLGFNIAVIYYFTLPKIREQFN